MKAQVALACPIWQSIWRVLLLTELTDRLPTALTEPPFDRLPTDLTAYADLTEVFEIFFSRLDVGELTDLTDKVG